MGLNLKEAAKKAQQRKTIYPKLKLGEEPETGSCIIRFDQPTFAEAINPNPLPGRGAEFMTVLVTVMQPDDFGHTEGEQFQLNAGPGSTLGDELLKLWTHYKENLMGKIARIEVYNYDHKKLHKQTRGYRVIDMPNWKPVSSG